MKKIVFAIAALATLGLSAPASAASSAITADGAAPVRALPHQDARLQLAQGVTVRIGPTYRKRVYRRPAVVVRRPVVRRSVVIKRPAMVRRCSTVWRAGRKVTTCRMVRR